MLKLFTQIIVFILALVYIGGRLGMLSTQVRNSQKNSFDFPARISNIPDSVWVARAYSKTIACDTLGLVHIELKLRDRASGWIEASHLRAGEGINCKFTTHFNLELVENHIKIHYPLGALEGEARCPVKCRYTTYLRGKIEPVYQDSTINGQTYQLLQLKEFNIVAL